MISEYINEYILEKRNILQNAVASGEMYPYVYAYPSKRTFRKTKSVTLKDIWNEDIKAANLYIHIPFCRYRCSYCTLFMTNNFNDETLEKYIEKIIDQIKTYANKLSNCEIKTIYFGGGTPTILSVDQFRVLFSVINDSFRVDRDCEITVESSPDSINYEKLVELRKMGVTKLSIGIQSLDEDELKKSCRPFDTKKLLQTMKIAKEAKFNNLNFDLIYGLPSQNKQKWFNTLETVINLEPESLTLYPIVVRDEAIVGKLKKNDASLFMENDKIYDLYDENIEFLKKHQYKQQSLTRFTKSDKPCYLQENLDFEGIPLIGIGAGARSYTNWFHYSHEYTTDKKETNDIIKKYIEEDFTLDNTINYGVKLSKVEQQRRFAALNISLGSIDSQKYKQIFKSDLLKDFFIEIKALLDENCIIINEFNNILLTDKGFKYSSIVSSLFFSDEMKELVKTWKL